MGRAEEARESRATQQEEDRQHDEMSRRGAHDGNGGEGDDACTPPMASLREDSRSLLALGRSLPRSARRGGAGNPQRRAASASSATARLALSAGHGRRRSPEHITVSSLVRPTSPVVRFDFSWDDAAYQQETPENVKLSIKATKKLCNVILDMANKRMSLLFSPLTRRPPPNCYPSTSLDSSRL